MVFRSREFSTLTRRDIAHTVIGFGALTAIGVGLWWINPSVALVAVGGVLLAGIIYSRTRK